MRRVRAWKCMEVREGGRLGFGAGSERDKTTGGSGHGSSSHHDACSLDACSQDLPVGKQDVVATPAATIKDRVSSFMMHARASLGKGAGRDGGLRVAVSSEGRRGQGLGQGSGAQGWLRRGVLGWGVAGSEQSSAGAGEGKGAGGGGLGAETDVSESEEIATQVGELSRAMEEGLYLMASEYEDVLLSRAQVQKDIGACSVSRQAHVMAGALGGLWMCVRLRGVDAGQACVVMLPGPSPCRCSNAID